MSNLFESILEEECKAEDVSIDLVNKIIELNEKYDSKDTREVVKRKKQIKKLLEESLDDL
jgi:hypothetical protein